MSPDERATLQALLERMRTVHDELTGHNAGICLLHLEAAVAALESHLRRGGRPAIEELRQGLVSRQATS